MGALGGTTGADATSTGTAAAFGGRGVAGSLRIKEGTAGRGKRWANSSSTSRLLLPAAAATSS
jgi:hypothetical protein